MGIIFNFIFTHVIDMCKNKIKGKAKMLKLPI